MQLNGAYVPTLRPTAMQHGFFRAIAVPPVWITRGASGRPYKEPVHGEQFAFRSVTHTEAKTTETKMTQWEGPLAEDVPVLRRGPVAAAAAAGGGLLERRGDRPRAFEELGVI